MHTIQRWVSTLLCLVARLGLTVFYSLLEKVVSAKTFVFDNLYSIGIDEKKSMSLDSSKFAPAQPFRNFNASGELRQLSVENIRKLGAYAADKFNAIQSTPF